MGRFALLAFVVFFVGCAVPSAQNSDTEDSGVVVSDPLPGAACTPLATDGGYSGYCAHDFQSVLYCSARTRLVRRVECRSATGCVLSNNAGFVCYRDDVRDGDGCFDGDEGSVACSLDAGRALTCLDGGFSGQRCDGGCAVVGTAVYCYP